MSILCRLSVQLLSLWLFAAAPMVARSSENDLKAVARKDADDTKRAVNKADDRIDEAGCTAGKAECARRKKTDRMEEAKEHVSDEIHEAADRARDDKK